MSNTHDYHRGEKNPNDLTHAFIFRDVSAVYKWFNLPNSTFRLVTNHSCEILLRMSRVSILYLPYRFVQSRGKNGWLIVMLCLMFALINYISILKKKEKKRKKLPWRKLYLRVDSIFCSNKSFEDGLFEKKKDSLMELYKFGMDFADWYFEKKIVN